MKQFLKKYISLGLFVILLGCADTDLDNISNPDASEVLASSSDYILVLDGGALAFWNALHKDNPYMTLSVAADHGSSSWGNFGMRQVGTVSEDPYGLGDHDEIINTVTGTYIDFLETPYEQLFGTISSVNDVLNALNANEEELSNRDEITAYAYLLRGMAYGYLGLLYDQSLIVKEGDDILNGFSFEDFSPYTDIITQAVADLDFAITTAEGTANISVSGFSGLTINQTTFLEIANSYAAKFLMHSPRTAAESSRVPWERVRDYARKGLQTTDLAPIGDGGISWWHAFVRQNNSGWMRVDQRIINMVNESSPYPYPQKGGYAIDTAAVIAMDKRFDGSKFGYIGPAPFRANRGRYFFCSWGFTEYLDYRTNLKDPMPSLEARENQLNLAEALLRLGEQGAAADIINETRVALGGKTPAMSGDSDLMDKLFYERYLEVYEGPGNPFFDRRRTDELGKKQFLHFPVPAKELNIWGAALYTTGGNNL